MRTVGQRLTPTLSRRGLKLAADRRQAVQHRLLSLLQVRNRQDSLGRPLLATFRFRQSTTASFTLADRFIDRSSLRVTQELT